MDPSSNKPFLPYKSPLLEPPFKVFILFLIRGGGWNFLFFFFLVEGGGFEFYFSRSCSARFFPLTLLLVLVTCVAAVQRREGEVECEREAQWGREARLAITVLVRHQVFSPSPLYAGHAGYFSWSLVCPDIFYFPCAGFFLVSPPPLPPPSRMGRSATKHNCCD